MAFSLWTWACDQLKPKTGQWIALKHITSMIELLHCSLRYSQLWHWSADTPFWQLSIDHNMDDHKNVHY